MSLPCHCLGSLFPLIETFLTKKGIPTLVSEILPKPHILYPRTLFLLLHLLNPILEHIKTIYGVKSCTLHFFWNYYIKSFTSIFNLICIRITAIYYETHPFRNFLSLRRGKAINQNSRWRLINSYVKPNRFEWRHCLCRCIGKCQKAILNLFNIKTLTYSKKFTLARV